MKKYNPKTIKEAMIALDTGLSKADKEFLSTNLGEDINYESYLKIKLMTANVSKNWLDNEKSALSKCIPNFDKKYSLDYGEAILEIYKRFFLGKPLYAEETLLKVNWAKCPIEILNNETY